MLSRLKETSPIVNKQSPGKFTCTRKQIGMVSKNLCKASVMKFVIAHLFPRKKMKMKMMLNHLWQPFKGQLHLGINKFIPSKIAKKKNLYPWIDADLRRLIRQRNRHFKIKNRTNNPRDINHYKFLIREVQRRVRQSYWSHVEEILEPRDAENTPPPPPPHYF